MPNLIHAGGLSVKPAKGKALPKEFEEFMASSNANGVILVTFGSMVSTLPKKTVLKLIDAFEQLSDYKIIWRFANHDNLEMPKNVMLSKWLPQNDILSDSRIKLFITHCGNNGQFEAVYHAVPMIGFPIFGDQHYNGRRLLNKGYGMSMNIHKFTAQELVENARTIIGDKSYKARVAKASEIFRSAKDTPAQRAAYWIEHVTKFGGAHLRSAGNDLALYQYFMLDVLLVVGVVIVTSFACVGKLMQLTWRKCRSVKSGAKNKSE
jgi:UDP:flavonoid glycosyltransferase YjiC (YdhE family)